jgi:methionyl-tRNA formyltransferase
MTVLLLTDDNPMYMPAYLEPVIRTHSDHLTEIVFAPNPNEDFGTMIRKRYKMFGSTAFLRYGFRYASGTLLSKLPSSLTTDYHSVGEIAREYDVPVRTETDINRSTFVSSVRKQGPDVILSIACGQLLGEDYLSIPDQGCINLHGSLLPEYRGRATAFWVLYHDEDVSGVIAHYMTSEFDSGDIIMQREFNINSTDTMDDVYWKIVENGLELAVDLLDRLARGEELPRRPNPTDEDEYRRFPGRRSDANSSAAATSSCELVPELPE